MSRAAHLALAMTLAALPNVASASVLEDRIQCAALFDVLDVGEMDDPTAFRAELDRVAGVFAGQFQAKHGVAAARNLRQHYRDHWQAKPQDDDTAIELAAVLSHCAIEARRLGLEITGTGPRDQP